MHGMCRGMDVDRLVTLLNHFKTVLKISCVHIIVLGIYHRFMYYVHVK